MISRPFWPSLHILIRYYNAKRLILQGIFFKIFDIFSVFLMEVGFFIPGNQDGILKAGATAVRQGHSVVQQDHQPYVE